MLRKQVPIAPKQGRLAPVSSRPAPSSTVLLTGFTPFGGDTLNVSWQVAQLLGGTIIDGHTVVAGPAADRIRHLARGADRSGRQAPSGAGGVPGQAGGRQRDIARAHRDQHHRRTHPRQRRQAAGRQTRRQRRPAGLFHQLADQGDAAGDLQAAGIPGEVSQTAGTYRLQPCLLRPDAHTGAPATLKAWTGRTPHWGAAPTAWQSQFRGALEMKTSLDDRSGGRGAGQARGRCARPLRSGRPAPQWGVRLAYTK
jgi:pyrrolidone-carboxylate peptidase